MNIIQRISKLEAKQAKFNEQIDKKIQKLSTEWVFGDKKEK